MCFDLVGCSNMLMCLFSRDFAVMAARMRVAFDRYFVSEMVLLHALAHGNERGDTTSSRGHM